MTPIRNNPLAAGLLATSTLLLGPSPTMGTEPAWDTPIPFDTLYVTADRIPQPFLTVPRSVSVLTAGAIEDANIASVQEASEWIPNVHIVEVGTRRLSFPYVRGVGSGEGNPAVATFVDGVPQLTVNTGGFDLLDVERIEFVRGPQGSLYGRNTLGGAIHVFSRKPGPKRRLGATLTTGDHARKEATLSASGPLGDTPWHFSAAGAFKEREGFTTNAFPGSNPSVDGRQSFQGRVRLDARMGRWDIRLSTHGERSNDGGFAFSDLETLASAPHEVRHDFDGETTRNVVGVSLHTQRAGDGWTVSSTTAYLAWDAIDVTDLDFMEYDLLRRRAELRRAEFTQELRALSNDMASPGRFGWVAGLAAFASTAEHAGSTNFFSLGIPGVNESDAALADLGLSAYGQATFSLSSSVDATAGLRYEHESKDATITGVTEVGGFPVGASAGDFANDFDRWIPRLALAWHPGDHVHAYVQLANGFKAGGYNESAPEGKIPFGPESSGVGEVGVKASWMEGRIVTSATAFGLRWNEMQLYVPDTEQPGSFYIDNAGQAKSAGFEAEITARLPGGAVASGSVGVTRTEFEEYTDPTMVDCSGNILPFAPEHTWSLGVRHGVNVNGGLRLTGNFGLVGTGAYFYDAANSEEQGAAEKINGGVGIGGGRWGAEIWVRNLADTHTIPVAFLSPLGTGFVGQSGEPRTAGVTFSVTY